MATQYSRAAVEEKLQMDLAIWKSEAALKSRSKELYCELVEGARIKLVDRDVATMSIGKLEWEVTLPSAYMGYYCNSHDENGDDDRLMMSSVSGFRVALRSPQGRCKVLHLCPTIEDWSRAERIVAVDEKLHDMLTRFFTSEETTLSVTPRLRRTMSQKKRADIVGKNFGPPFLRCVFGLQTATGISDVLDAVLEFSAAYLSNQQILEQLPEVDDEDCYFYDHEEDVEEELAMFNARKRSASLWVRQQVRHAAMKCLASVEATSEVVDLGVEMLLKIKQEAPLYDTPILCGYASDMLRMSRNILHQGNGENTSTQVKSQIVQDDPKLNPGSSGSANPSGSAESGRGVDDSNNPPGPVFLRTRSFITRWQSEIGNDTDVVQADDLTEDAEEGEDNVLGTGITDAESLDLMLRDRDPCGNSDCSNLINEFVNLQMSNASASPNKGLNVGELDISRCSVLKRLKSWSSTNSGWPDREFPLTPGPMTSRRLGTVPLGSLAEEPFTETDPETARLCQAFTGRAAAKGDVLQWCSCIFNKARSSIELRFQVGSFMQDDIATFSTGIVLGSSLRIEIFLDAANMRQSLLDGNVRISVDQPGLPTEVTPPVIGMSCYIPHLVRHYLKRHIHEQSTSGYEFPDGELLTGLMKYVVAKLVFMKRSCCVCDQAPDHPEPINSFLPRPCDQNLCQALHEAWLVVAPRIMVEESTVEHWLRNSFQRGNYLDERRMLQYMDLPLDAWVEQSDYLYKLTLVVKWLRKKTLRSSTWITMVDDTDATTKEELDYSAKLLSLDR